MELKKNNKRKFYLAAAGLIFVCLGAAGGYIANSLRVKPVYFKAYAKNPQVSTADKIPGKVVVSFFGNSALKSVASLELSGKKIEKGIKIEPFHKGSFQWINGKTLVFFPKDKWPAGQKFNISFDKSIFGEKVRLEKYSAGFKTPEFKTRIKSMRFYTDPRDRKLHKGVATLLFNYPVDKLSLRDFIKLGINKEDIDYDLTFNKERTEAYINSAPLKIEKEKRYLNLVVFKGVKTTLGGETKSFVKRKIVIPGMHSFFRVKSLNSIIVKDKEGKPHQTLLIDFTDEIEKEKLLGKVKAYLLPKRKRGYWNSPSEVLDSVLAKSKEIKLEIADTARKTSATFGFRFDAPEGRDLYVVIEKGIKSASGFELTRFFDSVKRVPQYPRELEIMGDGGILSMSGKRKLSFRSRGIKGIKVVVSRLVDNQLHHLVSQGTWGRNVRFYGGFDKENISSRFEKIIPLNMKNSKDSMYSSFDLGRYLQANGKKPGFFFVEANSYDPERKYTTGITDRRAVLITDLLILVKENSDYTRDIFVQSVSTGNPVKGAKLAILGKNGLPVLRAVTDDQGHAFFKSTRDFKREKRPVACTARFGNDFSFIELNKYMRNLELSGFQTGGERSRYLNPKRVDAFVFNDRGIYRPGESFNIGAIVRHKKFKVPSGIPVEYTIYDSRSNIRLKKRIKVPKSGFFDVSFKTSETDPTGTWNFDVYLVSKKGYRENLIGSTSLKIEAFQPDRLKIKSMLSDKSPGWTTPKDLKADITLFNMFGSPAEERKIKSRLKLTPSSFYFRKFSDFVFTDPYYRSDRLKRTINKNLKDVYTDKKGLAEIELGLDAYEKGTYRLNLNVEGFEKGNGRSVTAINKALISPLEKLIGYKSDSDLYFLKKGSTHEIEMISIDRFLNKKPMEDLKFTLKKTEMVSALIKKNDGTYAYQSTKKEKIVEKKDFSIPEKGRKFKLNTKEGGTFSIEIEKGDQLVSRLEYHVYADEEGSGGIDKRSELSIGIPGKDVAAGSFLEVEITAPYKGSGLISIETDKVHSYKWFKTNGGRTMEKVRIHDYLEGNAYVSATMVRAPDDPSIFQSPLTYSVKSFKINRAKRILKTNIKIPEKVKPGEKLVVEYSTQRKAKLALFAADSGILQVSGYKKPEPLNHFLKKKALEVETFQMADLILPEYNVIRKKLGIGGGARFASAKAFSANVNPFKRKVNNPAVHWFGVLESDVNPKKAEWKIPETFNGEVQVFAVAADEFGMGTDHEYLKVKGPFVLTPSMPGNISPGDRFKISLGIANLVENSKKDLPVTIEIKPGKGIKIEGETLRTINIDENSEKSLEIIAVAEKSYGGTEIEFKASSKDKTSSTKSFISIRPYKPEKTTMISGAAKNGKKDLKINRKLEKELAGQKLRASVSPLVMLNELSGFTDLSEHDPTDRLSGKGFSWLILKKHGLLNGDEASEKTMEKLVSLLRQRQTYYGGFSNWPGVRKSDDFTSLFTIHFFIEAKEYGYDVPGDIITRSKSFLEKNASKNARDINSLRTKSYAVYLLTRLGRRTHNHLLDMDESVWADKSLQNDMISVFEAGAYSLLKNDHQAKKHIESYEPGVVSVKRSFSDSFYLYILGKHFSSDYKKVSKKDITNVLTPVFNGETRGISAFAAILGVGSYGGSFVDKKNFDEKISFKAFDKEGKELGLKMEKSFFKEAKIPVDAENIEIKGPLNLYYSFIQKGYDKEDITKDIKEKIEVKRNFETMDGKELEKLSPGEDFMVKIKVRSLVGKVANIELRDVFTGGFYPDLKSLRKNQNSKNIEYIDIREDKAVFYGWFSGEITTISYKARAMSAGEYKVPGLYLESMFHPEIKAETIAEVMKIEEN